MGLCRLTVWKGSSGRPKGNGSSSRDSTGESKGGNVKKTHSETDT